MQRDQPRQLSLVSLLLSRRSSDAKGVSSELESMEPPLSTVWPIIDHQAGQSLCYLFQIMAWTRRCLPVGKSITRTKNLPPCKTNAKFTTVFLVPSQSMFYPPLPRLLICCGRRVLLVADTVPLDQQWHTKWCTFYAIFL